jgi:hypothetical protein
MQAHVHLRLSPCFRTVPPLAVRSYAAWKHTQDAKPISGCQEADYTSNFTSRRRPSEKASAAKPGS